MGFSPLVMPYTKLLKILQTLHFHRYDTAPYTVLVALQQGIPLWYNYPDIYQTIIWLLVQLSPTRGIPSAWRELFTCYFTSNPSDWQNTVTCQLLYFSTYVTPFSCIMLEFRQLGYLMYWFYCIVPKFYCQPLIFGDYIVWFNFTCVAITSAVSQIVNVLLVLFTLQQASLRLSTLIFHGFDCLVWFYISQPLMP